VRAVPASLEAGRPIPVDKALTIADGIAVKRPGELTLGLFAAWLDSMAVVEDEDTAEAMFVLMERCKLVVEGAGAVGVAALLGDQVAPAPHGTTVVVLSGGNVDPACCSRSPAVTRRWPAAGSSALARARPARRARRPADVRGRGGRQRRRRLHVREGFDLHVRETAVELVLETRGREHANHVIGAMRGHGYPAQPLE